MNSQSYIDLAAVIVSVIALLVSYFSYKETKRARIELGQAFLSMELIQNSEGVYVLLHNLGNTYAYDVKVSVTKEFVNGFENLNILQPGSNYRFLLLNNQNISEYPEIITFTVMYHDYYSQRHFIKKEYKFKLVDYLKYDINYNRDLNCYDIKKSF